MDDLLCSCVNSKANDDLLKWAQEEYGQLKPVTAKRGTRHEFLGMTLDFGVEIGTCHVTQILHIQDMLDTWPEQLKENSPTPAGQDLFKRGAGRLLSDEK